MTSLPRSEAAPLRLLFVCNFYPPQHLGGYEELCQEVAEGLRQRGHQVMVLTSRPLAGRGGRAVDEASVIRTLEPEVAIGERWAGLRLLLGRRRRIARNRAAVDAALRAQQPQAVAIWGMWNLSPAVARQLEVVMGDRLLYYVADYWPGLPEAWAQHLSAPAHRPHAGPLKRLLALARFGPSRRLGDGLRLAQVACVSRAVLDSLRSQGFAQGTAEVIHNGIDLERFAPQPDDPPPPPPLRLLLAGRLSPDKGLWVALEAVGLACRAGLPLELGLLGSAPPEVEAQLAERIRAEGLEGRVQRPGRLPRERLPAVLGRHHALLVPSLWEDPLPRSAQEGMACGLAVIASRIGGLPELIEDGVSGLLVPPGDAARLAAAIARLATEPELRAQLGAAGRERVRAAFDIRRTVEDLEARLRALAGGRARGGGRA